MAGDLDTTMQRASEALACMDYLTCERLCLEALAKARGESNWPYYRRILLPLQESRRQRRMIAADGCIRLGTADLDEDVLSWLDQLGAGCIAVTWPHTVETARQLSQIAMDRRLYVEVLFVDCAADVAQWAIQSYRGPHVRCIWPAPSDSWINRWLSPPTDYPVTVPSQPVRSADQLNLPLYPADWFLDACEALGDTALTQVGADLNGSDRVEALEKCLEVVADHEILHQRLGDAATGR